MEQPIRADIRLEGETVLVGGPDLDGEYDRLFFSALLGGEAGDEGWACPVRDGDGDELVLRIARHLRGQGYEVSATSDRAEQALERDLQRAVSFQRALEAGRDWHAQLDEAVRPGSAGVLATLEAAGWDAEQRRLRGHQLAGAMLALSAANTANFSVPGAGKTATALAVLATHLQLQKVQFAVVVGPLSAFAPWEREAAAALPGRLRVRRVRGTPDARRAVWRDVGVGDVVLLTYPTAVNDAEELRRLARGDKEFMLVVDESHRVKRFIGGTWAPALIEVARLAKVRMILSGTPMPQSALDLWSQFMILWPGEELTGPRARFRARANNSFDALRDSLVPFFVRTPKRTLGLIDYHLDRPPVSLAPVQAEIYRSIVTGLRQVVAAAPGPLQDRIDALRRARPIRLLQAASNPDLLNADDGFYEIPPLLEPPADVMDRLRDYRQLGELPAKFAWGLNYLHGLRDSVPPQKCVVWTSFIRNIDQFAELVERELGGPVWKVDGRLPAAIEEGAPGAEDEMNDTREAAIDAFLSAEGFAVLVANPGACAESISLHSHCHRALYLDRTYDCARWLQSIDRIHRLGLPEGVQVEIRVPLVDDNGAPTIDALVDASLLRKQQRMETLLAGAELAPEQLGDQDTLPAAQGDPGDLAAIIAYLLGEDVQVVRGG
jgi:hypothetical protein